MDKTKVKSILAPFSPPLSSSQVDAIATEIISELLKTPEAPKPFRKSKSRN